MHNKHTCSASFQDVKTISRPAAPQNTLAPRINAASPLCSHTPSKMTATLHDSKTNSHPEASPQAIVRVDSAKSLLCCASLQQTTHQRVLGMDPKAPSRLATPPQVPARTIPAIDALLEKRAAVAAACSNLAYGAPASTYALYESLSKKMTTSDDANVDKANDIAKVDEANDNAQAKAAATNAVAVADTTTSVEAIAETKASNNAEIGASRCSKPPLHTNYRTGRLSTPTGTPLHTPRMTNSPSPSPTLSEGSGSSCAQSPPAPPVRKASPTPSRYVDPERASCISARAKDTKSDHQTIAFQNVHTAYRKPNIPAPAGNSSSGTAKRIVGSIIDKMRNMNFAATANKHSPNTDRESISMYTTTSSDKKTDSDIAPVVQYDASTTNPTGCDSVSRHSSPRRAATVLQVVPVRQHTLKQRNIEQASPGAIRLPSLSFLGTSTHVRAHLRKRSGIIWACTH